MAALECRDVTVRFGSFTAVSEFSYSFEEGRVYAIIGPNGAGKTTLMNAIVGGQRLSDGSISLFGRNVSKTGVPGRARLGLGRSFQISKVFGAMTVFENLRLAAQVNAFGRQPFWRAASGCLTLVRSAEQMLAQIGLEPFRDVPAEKLSHGDQRALELGLTLMPNPRLLLLDEPLAGVGHQTMATAMQLLKRVMTGRTVLLIEHNMDAVMSLASTVLVMTGGKLLASGSGDEIRRDARVRAAYLGSKHA